MRIMKNLLSIYCIFSFILHTFQTDFHIIKWERLITNDNYVHIETATVVDGNRFTVKYQTMKSVDSVYVRVRFFKKDSKNEFRELYKHFPGFEWCEIMKTVSKFSSNILAKSAVIFMKKIAPELMQPCPIKPYKVEKINITVPNVIIAMVPTGDYRITLIMRAKNGDVYYNSSAIIRVEF